MRREEMLVRQLRAALLALTHPHTGHLMHPEGECTGECREAMAALEVSAGLDIKLEHVVGCPRSATSFLSCHRCCLEREYDYLSSDPTRSDWEERRMRALGFVLWPEGVPDVAAVKRDGARTPPALGDVVLVQWKEGHVKGQRVEGMEKSRPGMVVEATSDELAISVHLTRLSPEGLIILVRVPVVEGEVGRTGWSWHARVPR